MYYGDYGNYNRPIETTKKLPQNGNIQKNTGAQSTAKAEELFFNFNKSVDAPSAQAMDLYNRASVNMSKKLDVDDRLGISNNDRALLARYVTPQQQTRISERMSAYFA